MSVMQKNYNRNNTVYKSEQILKYNNSVFESVSKSLRAYSNSRTVLADSTGEDDSSITNSQIQGYKYA